jgi:hypothetical protein
VTLRSKSNLPIILSLFCSLLSLRLTIFRASTANWDVPPSGASVAAFGVGGSLQAPTKAAACATQDALVNIPANSSMESAGLLIGEGYLLVLGEDAEIVLNEVPEAPASQWKCKTEAEVDFRCSSNWDVGLLEALHPMNLQPKLTLFILVPL